jgi:primosomal protein N' (replication factor Y)
VARALPSSASAPGPAEWHSDLTGAERRSAWRAIARGEARVVVGARSALFLPFPDLGLVIVDEEHEQAYKQEDGVAYQARDMAVLRGHLARVPVLLVSATPSLETLKNVAGGRYRALHLPDRHAGAALPRSGPWTSGATGRRASAGSPRAGVRAGGDWPRASRRALPQSPGLCAADPLPPLRPSHELPQLPAWLVEHRHAGRLNATIAVIRPLPEACPACAPRAASPPAAPGSNAWRRRRPRSFRPRASRF